MIPARRIPLFLTLAAVLASAVLPAAALPAASPAQGGLPRIRLVATGGTIANRAGARLGPAELVRLVPQVDRYARVDVEAFANVASGQLTLEQWLTLARRLNAIQREDDCAGVVVTSGTDTLEELAWFLHLTVRSDKPVVVVGSMRPPDAAVYDGAANLLAAIRVAASPDSRERGTLVVMNDEIQAAREVVKADAQRLDAFQSHRYGALGVVDTDRIVYYRRGEKRGGARSEFDVEDVMSLPRVDVLLTYQGASGDLVRAAADYGAAGLVIATAAGGTSGTQGDGIRYALSKRVVIVTATRTGAGRVAPAGEPGRVLALPGTIAAEDLAPVKARILLMLALAKTTDPRELQRIFQQY